MSQANRVEAFQAAVNAFRNVESCLANGIKVKQDELDLIRYALRSGFIKALIDNALSEVERKEFDAAMAGRALVFFNQEDISNVY